MPGEFAELTVAPAQRAFAVHRTLEANGTRATHWLSHDEVRC